MSKEKDHIRAVKASESKLRSSQDLPAIVRQVQENSLTILLSYLEQLFSSCDDLFFDLSSRATSNNEQNLYFESMRELRIKKNGILTNYRHKLEQLFSDCSQGIKPKWSHTGHNASEDGLSLVHHDEIEQDVAINSMVSKARSNNQEALHQLNVRLDSLIPSIHIDAHSNPVDPMQLCQSFAQACELLDINIKAKIILYKQFERLVVSRLANIYSNINDLLINAGVIPKVNRNINKSESYSQGAAQTEESGEDIQEVAFEQSKVQFDELSQLLASLCALNIQQLPNYQAYSSNPGPVMKNKDLLAAINILQRQFSSASDAMYIHQLINEVLSQSDPKAPQAVQQTDEDVINLVAMFFDFVLDDRNLPVAIQALIGRLQIPILKVALKDKSFFDNSNHPARQLVNQLAEISIGLSDVVDLEKDKTYQLVASIIHDIQEHYVSDAGIFHTKLQELEKFNNRDKHRSELIEKRTNQAEEGKAKTDNAKQATQSILLEKLFNAFLPALIFDFLINQWQQLLTLIHLKHGEDSPEWIDAIQLIDDLIWACNQQKDEKALLRLSKIKGHLMQRISEGLKAITITDEQANQLNQQIAEVVDQCQNSNQVNTAPLSSEQAKNLGHTPGTGTKSWKDMSALERQQTRYKKLTYEFIKKAEETPLNSWFSYEDINTGQTIRCKLSTRIESSDTYIFVNRLGFKALKKARKDFAYDMQRGRAKQLFTEPLFDRALSAIRDALEGPLKNTPNQPNEH